MLQCSIIPPESDLNYTTLIALFLFYLKLKYNIIKYKSYVGL